MPYKLNAKSDKSKQINEMLLNKLVLKGWIIDRFGNAKKTKHGKNYRLKFQAQTIRHEVQVIHEPTGYRTETQKEWIRFDTTRYTGYSMDKLQS